jgi:hypothetical protein
VNLAEALVNQNGDKIDNPQDYSPLIANADEATTTTAATLDTPNPGTLDDTATTIEGSHKIYPHKYLYYKNREAVLCDLEKQKSHTVYHGTSRGARFYGAAAALNPQSSFKNMEIIFALAQAALLTDAGFDDVELEDFACSVPSAQTISEHVAKTATDSKFLAAEEILSVESKVFLICDTGALKTQNAHFVKILAWYSKEEGRIKTFVIDADDSDGTSEDCAETILHSLERFFGDAETIKAILNGQNTDSGGGGTGVSFYKTLDSLGLCVSRDEYMVSYCTEKVHPNVTESVTFLP